MADYPEITEYTGDIPNRLTQSSFVFSTNMAAFQNWMPTAIEQVNDAGQYVEGQAAAATASATASANSAAASAGSANWKGDWEDATGTAAAGESYSYGNEFIYLLKVDLADIQSSEPSPTNSDWQMINRIAPYVPDVASTLSLKFAENKATVYSNEYGLQQMPIQDAVTATRSTTATFKNAISGISTAAINRARMQWEDGIPQGYLSEESRTNSWINSNDFGSGWSEVNTTAVSSSARYIQRDVEAGPDGGITADRITVSNSDDAQSIFRSSSLSGSQTFSVFFKADTISRVSIYSTNTSSNPLNFDLSTGAAQSLPSGATVKECTDGWYRLSITVTETNPVFQISLPNDSWEFGYIGNGTDSIYLWGAQLEEGSFPTSYIKTEGSQVTRGADSMLRTLGDEWNPNEGTFVVEFDISNALSLSEIRILGNGGSARLFYTVLGANILYSYDGGTGMNFGDPVLDGTNIAALSVTSDSMTGSLNGASAVTRSHNGNLLSISAIKMFEQGSGLIKRIDYYPKALSASELQELSRL